MGPICNDRATNKEFVPPSALFPEILVFGSWTLRLVLSRRRGCLGGLEICCGARAVRHSPRWSPYHHPIAPSILPGWAEPQANSAAPSPGDQEL